MNDDRRYLRNRVRHDLLPLLETYNPKIRASLCRTAEALAGDFDLLQSAVQDAWGRTVRPSDGDRVVLDRSRLQAETQAMQRALIRQGAQLLRGSTRGTLVEARCRRGRNRAQWERGRAGRDAWRSGAHCRLRRCHARSQDRSLALGQSASHSRRVDTERARRPGAARRQLACHVRAVKPVCAARRLAPPFKAVPRLAGCGPFGPDATPASPTKWRPSCAARHGGARRR